MPNSFSFKQFLKFLKWQYRCSPFEGTPKRKKIFGRKKKCWFHRFYWWFVELILHLYRSFPRWGWINDGRWYRASDCAWLWLRDCKCVRLEWVWLGFSEVVWTQNMSSKYRVCHLLVKPLMEVKTAYSTISAASQLRTVLQTFCMRQRYFYFIVQLEFGLLCRLRIDMKNDNRNI